MEILEFEKKNMRRFEMVEGSASKFWQVEVQENRVIVCFGRIGTAGQTKEKLLADATAAQKEQDKLIKEKLGKGYQEVAAAGADTTAQAVNTVAVNTVVVNTVAVASECTPTTAPVASPAPMALAAPMAPAASVVEEVDAPSPAELLIWTDELRASLPVVRGLNAPVCPILPTWLDQGLDLEYADDTESLSENLNACAQTLGQTWILWRAADRKEQLSEARLRQADPEHWTQAFAQVAQLQGRKRGDDPKAWDDELPLLALIDLGLRWHGAAFVLECLFSIRQLDALDVGSDDEDSVFTPDEPPAAWKALRAWLAQCAEPEYQAALACMAGWSRRGVVLRAALCPERSDWLALAREAMKTHADEFLMDCYLPLEAAHQRAYWSRSFWLNYGYGDNGRLLSAILLQLHVHGSAALSLLEEELPAVDGAQAEIAAAVLCQLQQPEAIYLLVRHQARWPEVAKRLQAWQASHPVATLHALASEWLKTPTLTGQQALVAAALRTPAAWSALLARHSGLRPLQPRLRQAAAPEASAEQLPALLHNPPWVQKRKPSAPPSKALPASDRAPALCWLPGEREALLGKAERNKSDQLDQRVRDFYLDGSERKDLLALLQGKSLKPDQLAALVDRVSPHVVLSWPDTLVTLAWNTLPPSLWMRYEDPGRCLRVAVARGGEALLPALRRYLAHDFSGALPACAAVADPALVAPMLAALRAQRKQGRDLLCQWLRRHVDLVAELALIEALNPKSAQYQDAVFGLRWLAGQGLRAALESQAQAVDASAELAALLDADPLLNYPSRLPTLPDFFAPVARAGLLLRDGTRVPEAGVEHLGRMLAFSSLSAPYAGLAQVREACDPDSLFNFLWDLYEAWHAAGAPAKHNWAFQALGLLGNDAVAVELAQRLRNWPTEGLSGRAVNGLELLAEMPCESALIQLQRLSMRLKSKPLQAKAGEKLVAVAAARGLSKEELEDRLAPDFGLDPSGSLTLDFGPRQFIVRFDEALKPLVLDTQGLRLKDLPKPLQTDDEALAADASARFKQLKKDAKDTANLQLQRLESAMVTQRRWQPQEFQRFYLQHPLMRHLATRLVWGVYNEAGVLTTAFRVAEDLSLADAQDQAYALPDEAQVGIAHPLELPTALRTAFGQVFGDYEILQPFKQLSRETYVLSAEEAEGALLTRFARKEIATGSALGLKQRNWRTEVGDNAHVESLSKPLAQDLWVELQLEPGWSSFAPLDEPTQTLRELQLCASNAHASWAQLPPIVLSELLREIELLATVRT